MKVIVHIFPYEFSVKLCTSLKTPSIEGNKKIAIVPIFDLIYNLILNTST